jgi:hypothetical protein
MKCNVCGAETRCYQLREVMGHPGMMMRGEGMIFTICNPCLVKLVVTIKTDATAIEAPEDVPITSPRVEQMMSRMMTGRIDALSKNKDAVKNKLNGLMP